MAAQDEFPREYPHIFIAGGGKVEGYRRRKQKIDPPPLPRRDRAAHAAALEAAIGAALAGAREQMGGRDPALATGVPGFYLEVVVPGGERAVIDQLANRRQGMEVVAVNDGAAGGLITASVFVPAQAENYYLTKVEAYRDQVTDAGRPRNEPLITRMETIRLGSARSLFTDEDRLFPSDPAERVWWEVWLRVGRREAFERLAFAMNLDLRRHAVKFPEREVVLVLSGTAALDRLVAHSDVMAELRRAKDTPAFFLGLGGAEQRAWTTELLGRVVPAAPGSMVAVCLLDSGVRRTHPLIEPHLGTADWHTIEPGWGADDTPAWQGHGTRMAGVALYGDLVPILAGTGPISPQFCLESVRILPPLDTPANDPELYGAITGEAVARAEIGAPRRRRVVTCAVSSASSSRGRPSSWSAAIDQLCFEEPDRRLVILSAGNISADLMG